MHALTDLQAPETPFPQNSPLSAPELAALPRSNPSDRFCTERDGLRPDGVVSRAFCAPPRGRSQQCGGCAADNHGISPPENSLLLNTGLARPDGVGPSVADCVARCPHPAHFGPTESTLTTSVHCPSRHPFGVVAVNVTDPSTAPPARLSASSLRAALGAFFRRTRPFSTVANLDWESISKLEEGLIDVLVAEDWDHRVPPYRKKVARSFRNRVFVQSVVAILILVAFAACSGGYIGVVGGIILYMVVVSEQYKATNRITSILDHSDCHAGYLRSRLAELRSLQQLDPETQLQFSEDPAYLPEPPPVYDLARTEPPAYGSPPTEAELAMAITRLSRPWPALIVDRSR